MSTSRSLILFASGLLALAGCAIAGADGPVATALQGVGGGEPPSGLNGKRPSCFWDANTRLAYQTLALQSLSPFPVLDAIEPSCRKEVLENVIQCALPHGMKVLDPFDGHLYAGWWGLAPTWMNAPPSGSDRRWVTACMAQRLNFFGASVDILLEGASSAIHAAPALAPIYPFDESIVWGDVFDPMTKINLYACWNGDLANLCPQAAFTWLNTRICDSVPSCGLEIVGPCSSACFLSSSTGYPVCKNPSDSGSIPTVENVNVWLNAQTTCL